METISTGAAPAPTFRLQIASVDVTQDVAPFVEQITYTDNIEGEADTLEVTLDNRDERWLNEWYPEYGDVLQCQLGNDLQLLASGEFEIDEIEAGNTGGNQVVLRGIAAGIQKKLRTRQGIAYDDTTLADIAATVADRQELELVGEIEPITIARATQMHETDLQFLHRLSREYDYVFSVKGSRLVFYRRADLRAQAPAITLRRNQLTTWSLREKIRDITRSATVSYHQPESRQTITGTAQREGKASADTLNIRVRAESQEQADAKAQAVLAAESEQRVVGELELPGDYRLVSGVVVQLTDVGRLSRNYLLGRATHTINRSGSWTANVEVRAME